jgi:hypothetical protein
MTLNNENQSLENQNENLWGRVKKAARQILADSRVKQAGALIASAFVMTAAGGVAFADPLHPHSPSAKEFSAASGVSDNLLPTHIGNTKITWNFVEDPLGGFTEVKGESHKNQNVTNGMCGVSYGTCQKGIATNVGATWTCLGSHGGSDVVCLAPTKTGEEGFKEVKSESQKSQNVTKGMCGPANGQIFSSAPTKNLCGDGSTPMVSGDGKTWTWTCKGPDGGSRCATQPYLASEGNSPNSCTYGVEATFAPYGNNGRHVILPYSDPSNNILVPYNGGNLALHVTTSRNCPWAISEHPSWVDVGGLGVPRPDIAGDTMINLKIPANPGSTRSGKIILAGKTISVTEQGAKHSQSPDDSCCTYDVEASGISWDKPLQVNGTTAYGILSYPPESKAASFSKNGGNLALHVTTSVNCPWAITEHPSWIDIYGLDDPRTSNAGNTMVNLMIPANPGSTRSGGITVAGQKIIVTEEGATYPQNTTRVTSAPSPV